MTAPQHNAEATAAQPGTEQANTGHANTKQANSQFTNRQKLQRCWFLALGLLGGFGFVTSQMSFALAETDSLVSNYASDSGEVAVNAETTAGSIITSKSGPNNYTTDSDRSATYSIAASDLSLEAPAFQVETHSQPVRGQPQASTATTSAVLPTVITTALPAFTQTRKPLAKAAAQQVAAPLSVYSHAQATLNQGTLVANVVSRQTLASAEPAAIATVDIAQNVAPEAVPDMAPASAPNILPAPVPAAPPIVQPTNIVPASLPEGSNLPEEYNSIFVDPTDYSVGATEAPITEAPSVVVSEQSTGCEFTVGRGGVPNGACGRASGNVGPTNSNPQTASGGYSAPAAVNVPEWQAPPTANAPSANTGHVSFSPAGIQLSTSAAGRDYLNRSVRPLVNLQAAEQFIFPLAIPSPITSLFGFRIHPIFGDYRFHAGTDIGAAQGTPVLAAQDGRVTSADYAGGYGLMVILRHGTEEDQLESRYAHLAEIFVEPGNVVKKGDIIGLVGSTGNSTGPHLHFEMHQLTADGWVLVNADGLVQASLANLVQALNNPMQTLSFNFSDFNLSNLRANGSIKAPNSSTEIPTFPGNNGIPFRPAQPNAS